MKKIAIHIMKWIFLVLFVTVLIYGFTITRIFIGNLQSPTSQERIAS